jgi:hypothetical protein
MQKQIGDEEGAHLFNFTFFDRIVGGDSIRSLYANLLIFNGSTALKIFCLDSRRTALFSLRYLNTRSSKFIYSMPI